MRLVTFGCSHTFGAGLPDVWDFENHTPIFTQGPSKYAWPQLLADKLNIECVNAGQPGASNKEVWYHIINTKFKKNDIVIILWPQLPRWCIIRKDRIDRIGPFAFDNKTAMTRDEVSRSKSYLKYMYEENDHFTDYFMRVDYVTMFLKNKIKILKHYESMKTISHPDWFISQFKKETFLEDVLHKHPKALDDEHAGEEGNKVFATSIYNEIKNEIT